MNYFLTIFRCTLHQRLGSFKSWLVLILLPLLVLSAHLMLPESDTASAVSVGVVLPESGGNAMWELLESRNDSILSFILTDEDTLDRNIAAGKWDCGIILAEDFDQRVRELDTDRIFTLRIGPGSAVYPLVKETVSACMAQLIGADITWEYLLDSGITDERVALDQVLSEPDRVLVTMSTLHGEPLQVPELTNRSTVHFLRWLICASILIRMLFGAADLCRWVHSPGMKRAQPLRSPISAMAARGAADALLLLFSASVALLLLGDGFWSIAAVFAYVVFWLMASLLLARFPGITTLLHGCIPFALVTSLILSPVLLDTSLILPGLSAISPWLPASLFLRSCNGDPAGLVYLLTGGSLALLLACTIRPNQKP